MIFSNRLVEEAVSQFCCLPGIGKRTALRLVLHLLKQPVRSTEHLSRALLSLRKDIRYCSVCHIIQDTTQCTCQGHGSDNSTICVVEDTADVYAIRNTQRFDGLFHVLGGRISPLDGIGPDDINVDSLFRRVEESPGHFREIICALSGTMEGDTTAHYIASRLEDVPGLKISTIARGIPMGGELEFSDELTIARSILSRTNLSAQ